jgi:acyl dehydratase
MARKSWSVSDFLARAGTEIGVSEWFLIDQRRINEFAAVTQDDQFIHTDPERARQTSFGGTIAHGYLTLSLLSAMAASALPVLEGTKVDLNYGFDKIRFLADVPAGASVRARFTLSSLAERGAGRWRMALGVVIETDRSEKPALIADWLLLLVT